MGDVRNDYNKSFAGHSAEMGSVFNNDFSWIDRPC